MANEGNNNDEDDSDEDEENEDDDDNSSSDSQSSTDEETKMTVYGVAQETFHGHLSCYLFSMRQINNVKTKERWLMMPIRKHINMFFQN